MYDFAIIGGGIVGLATALALQNRFPNAQISVLEKEPQLACHQTGNNSGVIHSGIYYKPGSLKARLSRAGSKSMVEFCQQHDIPHDVCGKVIVATAQNQLTQLEKLYQRGLENGLEVAKISAEEVKEIEPHVSCLAGIRVKTTGIVDYRQVCEKYAQLISEAGGEIRLNTKVENWREMGETIILETSQGEIEAKFVINCGGLFSDRLTQMSGMQPQAKIIPFRGEYYELKPEKRYLVKNLIYPVPNPEFPFLGVHFTRMIDGSVHAGPNAVLSLKREGYQKTDVDLADVADMLTYPGLWKLAAKHGKEGIKEIIRSFSKAAFVHSLQQLIPEVQAEDVIPTHAGVRAQALKPDGALVDDFLILQDKRKMHVCNAPSPAATASLEIGREIAAQVPELQGLMTYS
ncbi:L-2-hydroxyglutarate oxidase [Roseofilum sp. BLCC_M154]|uniref:L-2-hydroxyglutarate oxidase n=1 Tax=Roseofilum acuticapitatum BLCC-M154 TaxID=3022444 RepID=A0ABT7AQ44_9CYAN|nr:L-2-hydroxyglutarate oxidase [Roseofilum acuticapitatum]MDJ1168559.1 L-2-hydroxyglutarate oxidase [Roseofilum acuticapitatum BLCC-M154]